MSQITIEQIDALLERPEEARELQAHLQTFVAIYRLRKDMEAREKVLREQIIALMEAQKQKRVDTPAGVFSRCVRKKWTFSDDVKMLEEEVKAAKKEEQENGKATMEETSNLSFKAIQ